MDDNLEKTKRKYDRILNKYFGYAALKKEQFEVIYEIVEKKRDVCAILNTGFGKSICYQMPYLITRKCVIIISPLISLIKEQCDQMKKLNIEACLLNSECKNKAMVKKEILDGNNKIIYITPEYFVHCEDFVTELHERESLGLIAIDEAHCVSSWGHSFRESYLQLGCAKEWVPEVPLLAMTATASEKIKKDMCNILELKKPIMITGSFDRPNLYLNVKCRDDFSDIAKLLQKYTDQYIIIYCLTRDDTETVSNKINGLGYKSDAYHAGLSTDIRNKIQDDFTQGKIKCMVATVAFGMGINIPNVRLIIHYSCPKNLESYYQEIGRAGRDGKTSECYMFYTSKDFSTSRYFLQSISDKHHKDYQEQQIRDIKNYVSATTCRRKILLAKFGEDLKENCNNCDNCKKPQKEQNDDKCDFTMQSYKLLSLVQSLDGKYGSGTYVGVLKGSNAKNISMHLKKNKFYAKGTEYTEKWWKQLVQMLVQNGFLQENSFGKFGVTIACSTIGVAWLKKLIKYNVMTEGTKMEDTDKLILMMTSEMQILNKKEKVSKEISIHDTVMEMDMDMNQDLNVNANILSAETITVKKGTKWTDQEESLLLHGVQIMTTTELAKKHKRTVGSIRSRLKEIAVKMHRDGMSLVQITEATKVTEEQLISYIAYKS